MSFVSTTYAMYVTRVYSIEYRVIHGVGEGDRVFEKGRKQRRRGQGWEKWSYVLLPHPVQIVCVKVLWKTWNEKDSWTEKSDFSRHIHGANVPSLCRALVWLLSCLSVTFSLTVGISRRLKSLTLLHEFNGVEFTCYLISVIYDLYLLMACNILLWELIVSKENWKLLIQLIHVRVRCSRFSPGDVYNPLPFLLMVPPSGHMTSILRVKTESEQGMDRTTQIHQIRLLGETSDGRFFRLGWSLFTDGWSWLSSCKWSHFYLAL